MAFTKSRAFIDQGSNLTPALVKHKGEYHTLLNHPVIQGLSPMTPLDQVQASTEMLEEKQANFWKEVPQIDEEEFKSFISIKESGFKKVKAQDWVALLKLYSYFCQSPQFKSNLEVGALIVICRETKQLDFAIPEQKVTSGSIDWNMLGKNLDLKKKVYFLDGSFVTAAELLDKYDIMGITHSHNVLFTSPSSTDDRYEIKDKDGICPSGVFILVGSFKDFQDWENKTPQYEVYTSIGHEGQRYQIQVEDLVEPFTQEDWLAWTFDRSILGAITLGNTWPSSSSAWGAAKSKYAVSATNKIQKRLSSSQFAFEGIQQLAADRGELNKEQTTSVLKDSTYRLLDSIIDLLFMELDEDPDTIFGSLVDYFAQFGQEYIFEEVQDYTSKKIEKAELELEDDIFSPFFVDEGR
jgi:hypothetical protein